LGSASLGGRGLEGYASFNILVPYDSTRQKPAFGPPGSEILSIRHVCSHLGVAAQAEHQLLLRHVEQAASLRREESPIVRDGEVHRRLSHGVGASTAADHHHVVRARRTSLQRVPTDGRGEASSEQLQCAHVSQPRRVAHWVGSTPGKSVCPRPTCAPPSVACASAWSRRGISTKLRRPAAFLSRPRGVSGVSGAHAQNNNSQ
jgi:hypothetical protein